MSVWLCYFNVSVSRGGSSIGNFNRTNWIYRTLTEALWKGACQMYTGTRAKKQSVPQQQTLMKGSVRIGLQIATKQS